MKPRVWKGRARSFENYDTNKEKNQEKMCPLHFGPIYQAL